jgi:hypothetical protein
MDAWRSTAVTGAEGRTLISFMLVVISRTIGNIMLMHYFHKRTINTWHQC